MAKGGKGGAKKKPQRKQQYYSAGQALNVVGEKLFKVFSEGRETSYSNTSLDDDSSFAQLHKAVEDLIIEQKKLGAIAPPSVASCLPAFEKWLKENDVAYDEFPIKVTPDLNEGCGIVATAPIKAGDLLLTIPKQTILSTITADEAGIGSIPVDQQSNPSVKLAMYLCLEKIAKGSRWKPFLDVLPRSFDLPLYWSLDELRALKGTFLFSTTISLIVSTIMHYQTIYRALPKSLFAKEQDNFTFEDYRWAVAAVMSRQNFVPINGVPTICLIPLWDMFNHTQGNSEISTFFSREKSSTECFAIADYQPGEQVFIHYGPRPNSMFLLYQGFIYPENLNDCITFHYHILRSDDKFKGAKKAFLMKHQINQSNLLLPRHGNIIDWKVMVAARASAATPDELRTQNAFEDPIGKEISLANEIAAVEIIKKGVDLIADWKSKNKPAVDQEVPVTSHLELAIAFSRIEEQTIEYAQQQCTNYLRALRKKEKRTKQRAKKKELKKEEEILQSAVEDLD